jgi:hypothetical protein
MADIFSQKLDQPLPTKDGGTMRTIREACDYMPAMVKSESCASTGSGFASSSSLSADVFAVSRALELHCARVPLRAVLSENRLKLVRIINRPHVVRSTITSYQGLGTPSVL